MKLVCAWCKSVILDGPGEIVSHGICELCVKKVEARELARGVENGRAPADKDYGFLAQPRDGSVEKMLDL